MPMLVAPELIGAFVMRCEWMPEDVTPWIDPASLIARAADAELFLALMELERQIWAESLALDVGYRPRKAPLAPIED